MVTIQKSPQRHNLDFETIFETVAVIFGDEDLTSFTLSPKIHKFSPPPRTSLHFHKTQNFYT